MSEGNFPVYYPGVVKRARRWRRAFLSLLLAIPALGFVGAGDLPMIILVATTLLVIGGVIFIALSLLERLFRVRS